MLIVQSSGAGFVWLFGEILPGGSSTRVRDARRPSGREATYPRRWFRRQVSPAGRSHRPKVPSEKIATVSPPSGLRKNSHDFLPITATQGPFANVVIERGSGHVQKTRQLRPVPFEVAERFAQRRVRLDPLLIQLAIDPFQKPGHSRFPVGLIKPQPLLGGHRLLASDGVVVIDDPEGRVLKR